jgi:spore maturation protein CgeB
VEEVSKRVLLAAPYSYGAYGRVIADVMNRMGHEVSVFDFRTHRLKGLKKLNLEFRRVLKFVNPEVLFSIKGEGLDSHVIKNYGGLTVNWWLDHHKRFSFFEEYYDAYDKLFLCEDGQGYPWMAIGIDPTLHKPTMPDNEIFMSDIIFAGTNHPKRTPRLGEIMRGIPYNFALWGNGYPEGMRQLRGRAIYYNHLMMAYTGSKLILNNHYRKGITPNMRSIEAPASGTAMLSDSGTGLEKCLNRGTEYIAYDSPKEARYLIRKYIEEPEEREKIAFAGMQRVYKDHLLEDKIKEMLK